MDAKQRAAKRDDLRKGMRVTPMMHRFIIRSFDEMDDFNEFMKSAIKRELRVTSERMEKTASRLDEEERERYYQDVAGDYQIIGDVFEKLALDSFAVILYSRIETGMGTLCDALYVNEKGLSIDELQMLTEHARRDSVLKYAHVQMETKRRLMMGKVVKMGSHSGGGVKKQKANKIK